MEAKRESEDFRFAYLLGSQGVPAAVGGWKNGIDVWGKGSWKRRSM